MSLGLSECQMWLPLRDEVVSDDINGYEFMTELEYM